MYAQGRKQDLLSHIKCGLSFQGVKFNLFTGLNKCKDLSVIPSKLIFRNVCKCKIEVTCTYIESCAN